VDTEITRDLVRRLYDAVGRGDVNAYADLIHDSIDWIIFGPIEVFPFEGPRKGKAAVLEVMAEIGKIYELKRHAPEIVVVDGDRAAMLANVAFVQRATGRTLTFKLANFLRFENNLLIEFRELSDTFDVTQQALGRWLKL
jgi:ketosteroid isomerase-like protein